MTNLSTETLFDETETANSKQIAILKKHFPQCFDKDGHFQPEKMMEVVKANEVDMVKESYSLNWLGKAYARLLTNLPPQKLLKPDTTHNESPENSDSGNILIKGDNLEVLKHLVNGYREKIKMIYIDPPYNTGSDGFVYKDDFKFTVDDLSRLAGIDKTEAERILSFNAKGSNSHSAWLTFMYPRLYIARELMRDDGVIFISIDENELSQLKILCDEIFGEVNFIECICWNKRIPKNDKGIGNIHEYVLLYAKDSSLKHEFLMPKEGFGDIQELLKKLKKDRKPISESEKEIKRFYKKNDYDRGITLYNSMDEDYQLWGKINMSWPNQDTFGPDYVIPHPKTGSPVKMPDRGWRWKLDTFNKAAKRINNEYTDIKELHDGSFMCGRIWFAADENTQPSSITYLEEVKQFLLRSILSTKSDGGVELEKLFKGKSYFSRPKSTSLIKTLIASVQNSQDAIVLDFFAGSGTTAHSVIDLNISDNCNRKFICMQLPEPTDNTKAAHKAGYKTIFDITKARITKVAKKITKENPDYKGDLGFKVFETIDDFRPKIDDDFEVANESLFDDMVLSDEQYKALLTTWMLYDNNELTADIISVDLQGYNAELISKNLYLIASDFGTQNLKCLLDKLDEDKSFAPDRVIVNGYNFDTAIQMELNEAIRSYQNKKKITINIIVRY